MRRFKGIIALDIDGTITFERERMEKKVSDFLNFLIREGWQLIFLTGRTFSFAMPVLCELEGVFYIAVQNGASVYKMPSEKLIRKQHLPIDMLCCIPEKV